MTATLVRPHNVRPRLLRDLDRPRDAFSNVTPNWFAVVMGTGVVGVAAASLPARFPGLRTVATAAWLLAAALLVGLGWLTAQHWRHHGTVARSHLSHPVLGHFYGALPMALLTVGTASLLLGPDVIGMSWAVGVNWVLWSVGTLAGLACAVAVPVTMWRRRVLARADAFGGWLMSVVPPMVSASAGALLIPHAPGGLRLALLFACYGMFAFSLLASAVVLTLLGGKLVRHGVGEARMVPTLWIVLGPLGQSITAANLLGTNAHLAVGPSDAATLRVFGLAYGLPVWLLAMAWAAVAATVTIRTARDGLPFSLTWWSFTFPVGTVVTGTTGLALHTGATLLRDVAVGGWIVLAAAWLVVATRTVHGGLIRGYLLAPPA